MLALFGPCADTGYNLQQEQPIVDIQYTILVHICNGQVRTGGGVIYVANDNCIILRVYHSILVQIPEENAAAGTCTAGEGVILAGDGSKSEALFFCKSLCCGIGTAYDGE